MSELNVLLAKAEAGTLTEPEFVTLSEIVAGDPAMEHAVTEVLNRGGQPAPDVAQPVNTVTDDEAAAGVEQAAVGGVDGHRELVRELIADAIVRCERARRSQQTGQTQNAIGQLVIAVTELAKAMELAAG